jgi:hypothetical protein
MCEPVIMVRFPTQAICVSLFQYVKERLWGPPTLVFSGYGESSPGVKRPGREADLSPPTITVVKIKWSYTSTPPLWSTQGSPNFKHLTAASRYTSSLKNSPQSQSCDKEAVGTSQMSQKHQLQKRSTTGRCPVDR